MKRFISYLAINMALLSLAFGQSVRGEYRSTLVWIKTRRLAIGLESINSPYAQVAVIHERRCGDIFHCHP
jgi:hypothetical protein